METGKKPVWVLVVVAVLLVALGGIGGFLARGSGSSTAPDPTGESWRLDYACPLAEQLETSKGSADDWDPPKLSDPNLDRISVIGAVLGGVTGGASTEDDDVTDMGVTLIRGVSTVNPELLVDGLERVSSHCAAR